MLTLDFHFNHFFSSLISLLCLVWALLMSPDLHGSQWMDRKMSILSSGLLLHCFLFLTCCCLTCNRCIYRNFFTLSATQQAFENQVAILQKINPLQCSCFDHHVYFVTCCLMCVFAILLIFSTRLWPNYHDSHYYHDVVKMFTKCFVHCYRHTEIIEQITETEQAFLLLFLKQ